MATILEHPEAQQLLDQTEVTPNTVQQCARRLTQFLQRYLPFFYRDEQRQHAQIILRGKLTGLQRKTTEPIAIDADLKLPPFAALRRRPAPWDDDAVLAELRFVTSTTTWATPKVFSSSTARPSPRKAANPVGSPGNGADAWARSTTLRRVCSWPTSHHAAGALD